jgi:hypothetical protein
MYRTVIAPGKPELRILPKKPRPWRTAWKEAMQRKEQAKIAT